MKWILLILIVGVIRGVVLPDYRWGPNIYLIPLVTPILLAALGIYLSASNRLQKVAALTTSLFSVYLSTSLGIVVYGLSVGWQYVTEDSESKAVFIATIGVQTITFIVAAFLLNIVAKRYNKRLS